MMRIITIIGSILLALFAGALLIAIIRSLLACFHFDQINAHLKLLPHYQLLYTIVSGFYVFALSAFQVCIAFASAKKASDTLTALLTCKILVFLFYIVFSILFILVFLLYLLLGASGAMLSLQGLFEATLTFAWLMSKALLTIPALQIALISIFGSHISYFWVKYLALKSPPILLLSAE